MSNESIATLPNLLASENIKKKFRDVLGENAAGFMSSILSAVNSNPKLKQAEPMSIISAAAVAAALDLPINPSLAFAHIVPYKNVAQFQMGWKGYVQLAQRTGLYLTINVSKVCEGELISENPFTGEINLSSAGKVSDKVIGYVAYFKLLNGFEKYLYMTKEQCEKHGKKYCNSYTEGWSWWQKDFDVMAMKTVIKALLSKWGPLSVKMQLALQADQSMIKEDGTYEYVDNVDNETGEIKEKQTKGMEGLKDKMKKPVAEKPTEKPKQPAIDLTEFEKKYFDLLASINDATAKAELSQIATHVDNMYNSDQSTMNEKEYMDICAMIEKRKAGLK